MAVTAQQIVPFGKNNQLIVNANTGTFTVKYNGKLILVNAAAAYANGNDQYQTKDYVKHTVTIQPLRDLLGSGKLLIIRSTRQNAPVMKQLFYCYTNRDFVVTELEIDGHDLSSNYMAPVIANQANLYAGSNLRTLFVPFDNDTFIRYQSKNLSDEVTTSSEVGVIYNDASRKGLVIGSLQHDNWKSGIKSLGANGVISRLEVFGGLNELAITRDSMAHGSLNGEVIKSPKMFIGYFADWRKGLETYARTNSIVDGRYVKPWSKATPIGWNSWGVIGVHLNYQNATGVADFFDKQIPKFRNEDGTAYIDLDSFWDNMVHGGFSGDFSKLKDFVNYCKERNLQPGVYWAPFTDWGKNPDRTAEGSNYKYADMWTKTSKGYHDLDGGRALDPTHPGTQARIAYVLGKLKETGFKMIKIDFLGHGAVESTHFYDPNVTTGMQAFRVGMETINKVLDNSMLLYAAISPSLATARYVHMRRIACDSFHSIKDAEYTLNSVTYGWWQTYIYDYVDADHAVFEKENAGANRARLISALITGSVILGDDYSKTADWQAQVKEWLQAPQLKQFLKSGKAFMPVESGIDNAAAQQFIRKDDNSIYLAVFNYKKQAANIVIDADRLRLMPGKKYKLTEVLGGENVNLTKNTAISFTQEGAYLYKITVN
ncbi:alpha-galactosidase [Mucilaginibacter sp. dw_454]|uniref:alpha-galactosidase n=1 Tax=Mucilaginibacter sp. dw_454 TaxID=2720079 RepID=UPI001BD3F8B1|nr:alpha-galactosidase [Mucilaginibacter sp. dw_454]